jgi:hypothetical protein
LAIAMSRAQVISRSRVRRPFAVLGSAVVITGRAYQN